MLTSWKAQGKLTNIYADGGGGNKQVLEMLGGKTRKRETQIQME
jgi:hypothetical protein